MTEYEMFMEMINRVYVSNKKNNTYWLDKFNIGEETDGNIKIVFIEDNANYFNFEFDEEGKLINIC